MRHRHLAWVPLVAGLVLASGCTDDGLTSDYELSGFVLEETSAIPIPNARVRFTSDTLYTEETTSDDDGQYEMVVVTDQPFGQVRAEAEGYRPAEQTVYFDAPQRRIDLRLRPTAGSGSGD